MALSIGPNPTNQQELEQQHSNDTSTDSEPTTKINTPTTFSPVDPPLIQLDLLPNTPVPRSNHHALPWPSSDYGNTIFQYVPFSFFSTLSQEGHMVRVVAGSVMWNGFEVFKALNS